jgi:Ca2+-binding RTX toxin-like protein
MADADMLTGGTGADHFDFDEVTDTGTLDGTRDTISDFNANESDKIDLSTIDANEVLAGNDAFQFIGTAEFSGTDASGQLRFDAVNHLLLGSTDADSDAEFSILLTGVNSMTGANFIL